MSKAFTPVTLAESERYYELWQQTPRRSLDYRDFADLGGIFQTFFGRYAL